MKLKISLHFSTTLSYYIDTKYIEQLSHCCVSIYCDNLKQKKNKYRLDTL